MRRLIPSHSTILVDHILLSIITQNPKVIEVKEEEEGALLK